MSWGHLYRALWGFTCCYYHIFFGIYCSLFCSCFAGSQCRNQSHGHLRRWQDYFHRGCKRHNLYPWQIIFTFFIKFNVISVFFFGFVTYILILPFNQFFNYTVDSHFLIICLFIYLFIIFLSFIYLFIYISLFIYYFFIYNYHFFHF